MCYGAEAAWVPAVVTALGAGASAVNSRNALNRADRETARGISSRAGLQREAGSRVQQQINDVAKSNPDAERRTQNDAFLAALRKSKTADGSLDIGGPGGDRFAADVGAARTGAVKEGNALSGQLAAIDAPGLQRQREARSFNDAATDLSMIADRGNGLDFLTQLRTAQAGQANPWVDAVGGGIQAFGQAYAGRKVKPKLSNYSPAALPSASLVDTGQRDARGFPIFAGGR